MDSRYFSDMRQDHIIEIGETLAQRRRRTGVIKNSGPLSERRCTISSMMPSASYQVTRMRNLSGGSNGSTASGSSTGSTTHLDSPFPSDILQLPIDFTQSNANSSLVPQLRESSSSSSHRKLDRSLSDSESDRLSNGSSQRSVNSSRYKTELCRPFEESGSCKYGDKCQFAHGMHELRNLTRHPKYKTELCRTFHTIGFCPYGPRCHFIHGDDSKPEGTAKSNNSRDKGQRDSVSGSSSPLSPSGSEDHGYFSSRSDNSPLMNQESRPVTNALSVNINNINNTEDTLEHHFNSVLTLNKHSNSAYHENGDRYNSNCSNQEVDIFSSVSYFNPDEVLDNAPKQISSPISSLHKVTKMDNLPTAADVSHWSSTRDAFSERSIGSMDPFHYSPTGSTGSDSGNISDCSGSMESLASSDQMLSSQHFAVLQSLACSNLGGVPVWS